MEKDRSPAPLPAHSPAELTCTPHPALAAGCSGCRDRERACLLRLRRLCSEADSVTSWGCVLTSQRLNAKPRAAFVTRCHLRGSVHPHWA